MGRGVRTGVNVEEEVEIWERVADMRGGVERLKMKAIHGHRHSAKKIWVCVGYTGPNLGEKNHHGRGN